MKIGILQTGHAPVELIRENGDYDAMFRRLLDGFGFGFVSYDIEGMSFPNSLEEADGWLITGSRHGVYENHPWIDPLEELIRAIRVNGQPLVGVCFGHQIVAQAFGGTVENSGNWTVGRTDYVIDGVPVSLNAWHQDHVTELPGNAEVVGSSQSCGFPALAYGDRIWTTQPHPEFVPDFLEGLIRTRGRGVVPEELLLEATSRLGQPLDSERVAARMAMVFRGTMVQ